MAVIDWPCVAQRRLGGAWLGSVIYGVLDVGEVWVLGQVNLRSGSVADADGVSIWYMGFSGFMDMYVLWGKQ